MKRKKEERHRNHSVYYEPKKENLKEQEEQYILRLQTEHSEDKKKGRPKYNKVRPYNRGSKLKNF